MAQGSAPTWMGGPAVLVAVAIGVTVPEVRFTTYAVALSGVIAIADGLPPTWIGRPAVLPAVSIGVTVPRPLPLVCVLATYTVLPSGVIAIASGSIPTSIGSPAGLAARSIAMTVPRRSRGARGSPRCHAS